MSQSLSEYEKMLMDVDEERKTSGKRRKEEEEVDEEEEARFEKRSRGRDEEEEDEIDFRLIPEGVDEEEEMEEEEEEEGEKEYGEEEEETQFVAEAKAVERLTKGISGATDYKQKFDKSADDFISQGIIDDIKKEKIKSYIFGITSTDLLIEYKNPSALILGYIMYSDVKYRNVDERSAYEKTKSYIDKLFEVTRKARVSKKAEVSEPSETKTTVTGVDIIRYYTFWKDVIFDEKGRK